MQEVKLTREKNGALGKEWSQKREGRRAQEGEWGRRGVRLNTEYIHVWKLEKKWNKKPKKKKEMGVFNFIRFIPIYLLSQQLNAEPPNLEEEVGVYHSQEKKTNSMQAGKPLNKLFQQFLPVYGQNYTAQGFQKKAVTHLNHCCQVSGTYATLYYRLSAALFSKWAVTCHWHHPLSDFQRQDHANQMPSLLFPEDPSKA